jgi:hypothetical protein
MCFTLCLIINHRCFLTSTIIPDNQINVVCNCLLSGDFIFKQLRTCTTLLIPTFNFSTCIRRHTFKLPVYGPREEGTVKNKSASSEIKLQFLQNTSTVMQRPSRVTTFTLRLALQPFVWQKSRNQFV